jgi:hypothetical protein
MPRGLNLDLRGRHEDLIENAGLMERREHFAGHVPGAELRKQALVCANEPQRIDVLLTRR